MGKGRKTNISKVEQINTNDFKVLKAEKNMYDKGFIVSILCKQCDKVTKLYYDTISNDFFEKDFKDIKCNYCHHEMNKLEEIDTNTNEIVGGGKPKETKSFKQRENIIIAQRIYAIKLNEGVCKEWEKEGAFKSWCDTHKMKSWKAIERKDKTQPHSPKNSYVTYASSKIANLENTQKNYTNDAKGLTKVMREIVNNVNGAMICSKELSEYLSLLIQNKDYIEDKEQIFNVINQVEEIQKELKVLNKNIESFKFK